MFNFSGQEFFIIAIFALLLFGPDKIPQLARTIGRFTREFNKYKSIMEQTLNAEIYRAEGPTKETISIEERIAKAGAASTAFSAAREPEGSDELTDEPAATDAAITSPAPKAPPKPSTAPPADEADEEDEE